METLETGVSAKNKFHHSPESAPNRYHGQKIGIESLPLRSKALLDKANTSHQVNQSIDINRDQSSASDKILEKIIKVASMTIEVSEYKKSKTKIEELVEKHEAYIIKENENNSYHRLENWLTIRVKQHQFNDLLNNIATVAKRVVIRNVNLKDVTEEYIDVTIRLKTKREVERRYLKILQQAKTIEDILNVEEKLGDIRTEIEAKEGRLKYLNDQISYSTINIYMYEEHKSNYLPSFFDRIVKAVKGGWENLLAFLIGLFYLWPWWMLIPVGFGLIQYLIKRKR